MQAGLAVILLIMTWLSRGDRQSMTLYLVTLIVPAGWAYVFWSGNQREEKARADGRWSLELAKKERNRAFAMLGGLVAVWIALALIVISVL